MFRTLLLVCAAAAAAVGVVSAGSLNDVEHIVIFMQENRPLDHYYGKLRGVRGFNDRAAPRLPNGNPPFFQPVNSSSDADAYMLPFPLLFNETSASCMPAPTMDYPTDTAMLNDGLVDAWCTARDPGFGMSHFNRDDLPFYYKLAESFTIGDQYFQSTLTATNPNRLMLFTGSNGLSVNSTYNTLDDSEPIVGYEWETMSEMLQARNVSWLTLKQLDDFDDDANQWFKSFKRAQPGSPLYQHGKTIVPDLVTAFGQLLADGSLPAVTTIVGPTHLSEHATNHPADGEELTASLVAQLQAHPDMYAKTVFILNYDEGGQFFDHVVPPLPPRNAQDGASTLPITGELTRTVQWGVPAGHPIGMGFRVPLVIVSPWTRGGYVFSEVSDHTSVVKFVEQRFNFTNPNLSPWRRAVASDLLAAFDFDAPDYSWPTLPSTAGNINASAYQCANLPAPTVPSKQAMPVQEPGTLKLRSMPYNTSVTAVVTAASSAPGVAVTMSNHGSTGVVLFVYDGLAPATAPKKFTIEPNKQLSWQWATAAAPHAYDLRVHGPNGYVRRLSGSGTPSLDATLRYDAATLSVVVDVAAVAAAAAGVAFADDCTVRVVDNAYGADNQTLTVAPSGGAASASVPVNASGHWYDVTVAAEGGSCVSAGAAFSRTFMGHVNPGFTTTSDPAMATGVSPFAEAVWRHPPMPIRQEDVAWDPKVACATSRQRRKDQCWELGADAEMVARQADAAV